MVQLYSLPLRLLQQLLVIRLQEAYQVDCFPAQSFLFNTIRRLLITFCYRHKFFFFCRGFFFTFFWKTQDPTSVMTLQYFSCVSSTFFLVGEFFSRLFSILKVFLFFSWLKFISWRVRPTQKQAVYGRIKCCLGVKP